MGKTYDFIIFLDDWVCQKIKSGDYKMTQKGLKTSRDFKNGIGKRVFYPFKQA